MSIITLTTDFGTADGYVGAMKGVILGLAPGATLVDIDHNVKRQNVRHGARVLRTATPFFPPGTIHIVVVDPGVGTDRRGIALQTSRATYVGPDNGVLTPFLNERLACVSLDNPATHRDTISATFHGRDIFAPAAAHLATGVPLLELGSPVNDPVAIPEPEPQRLTDGTLLAEIVYVDHFGNLATNVRLSDLDKAALLDLDVRAGDISLDVHRTYGDVAPGTPLALQGSDGYLEIAVRQGNASQKLGLGVGTKIRVRGL